jgi:hypothetical protein
VPSGEIHVQLAVNYGEDPKLRALARFGRDARGCRDLYVQMVCYCKRNLTDGIVPAEELGVLVYPDSPKIGRRDADRLVQVGLVEPHGDDYRIPGFLKRNKSKAEVEAISAAKAESGRRGGVRSGQVRRTEAKPKHSASQDGKQVASQGEANAKHSASPVLEHIGHRSETETETQFPDGVASDAGEGSPKTRRGTRIPADFGITPEMSEWGREKCPHVNGRAETEKFLNYWTAKSGKDAAKLDWLATWRNWMLTAEERTGRPLAAVNGHPVPAGTSPRDEHRMRR